MSIPTYNFVWQQGEDGEINLVYKQNGTPVNLTGYKVRMDVKAQGSNTVLMTFNTAASDTGGETTSGVDATVNASGQIQITVPRTASLTGGQLFSVLGTTLNYDIFLRDAASKQKKILTGTILIEPSYTLWT